ncbi:MAG: hypothetical protein AAFZ15_03740 [Bacteroidota bacterium]
MTLPESHILVGEKMLDSQHVTSLFESERNLWIAEVDGFEVEMQITPSKVRACSCECAVFQDEKMCGHVAAGLMMLRKHLAEKKANAKAQKKTYQKLTVNAILDQVGQEELSAFVRYYARSNRQFSIALKTRFASAVPMVDNAEKYRQVIISVLKNARNKNDRFSVPGTKQLLSTGRDLLGQANDALALEHFVDCWSVLHVLIEKLVPVVNRTDYETEAFLDFSGKCFDLLKRLISKPIPPMLRTEIWDFLLKLAEQPIFRGYDLGMNFYQQLLPLADDKLKSTALLTVVDKELRNRHRLSEKYVKQLIACKLIILQKKGFATLAREYLKSVLTSTDQVLFVVGTAVEHGLNKMAKKIGNKGLELSDHHLYQYRLKVMLLDIAIAESDAENVVKWGKDSFVATGNVKYIRLCKQYFKGQWPVFLEAIILETATKNPFDKNEILANLYGEEKLIEPLGKIALEEGTIDFLMKYDHHFLPDHTKELYDHYVHLMNKYFSNHLGIKPTRKMLHLFDHLRQIGAQPLVDKLAIFVRKYHPKRMELAMELMLQ